MSNSKDLKDLSHGLKALDAPSSCIRYEQAAQSPWSPGKPLVSVIIPCVNYGETLKAAIASVLSQTLKDLEIIVVSSHSTDGTSARIIKELSMPKTRKYFRRRRHLVGDNRNFGIAKAEGKYICCLDPDDTIAPLFLEKSVFLLECAAYDIVSSAYQYFGERDEAVSLPARPSFSQVMTGASMSSIAVYSKQFFYKLGKYRDTGIDAEHIPEDWDFYIRAAGMGARMYNLPEPLINVCWHSQSLSRSAKNPSYHAQLQALRRRHKKVLQLRNFEQFTDNNAAVISVSSALQNMLNGERTDGQPYRLIIGPSAISQLEISEHMERLTTKKLSGKLMVLCPGFSSCMPDRLRAFYRGLDADVFYVDNMCPNEGLATTLLEYLIRSRNVQEVFFHSRTFSTDSAIELLRLKDWLKNLHS